MNPEPFASIAVLCTDDRQRAAADALCRRGYGVERFIPGESNPQLLAQTDFLLLPVLVEPALLPLLSQCRCGTILLCGRVTDELARLLTAFGAQLTVCARSPKDLALARSFGLTTLPLAQMDTLLPQQQLIFNTVPAPILGKEQLRLLPGDCLLIDLASGEGGIDHPAAHSLGLRCLHALALPAKTAPVTAGNILCDTVIQMITDIQSKTR